MTADEARKVLFLINVEYYKQKEYDKIRWIDADTGEEIRFISKQVQALRYMDESDITSVGYGGAARAGKTLLICADNLFSVHAYPGLKNMIGRTTVKNYLETTHETMKNLYRSFGIKEGYDCTRASTQSTLISFKNGSKFIIKDYTKQKIDDLGSVEIYRAYIDQSEQVNINVIDKILERVNTDRMCHKYGLVGSCLEGFNPKKGHETTRFWIPFRDKNELDKRRFVRALPSDNPGKASRQWVRDKISDYHAGIMREVDYQKQVLGNFDFDDDPYLMLPYEVIDDLFTNTDLGGDYRMIVDPAGKGKDELNISVFRGCTLIYFEEYVTNDNVQLISHMERIKAKYGIANRNICFDVIGVGFGITGRFKGAYEFASNSKAIRTGESGEKIYNSLRDDCGYKLEEMCKQNKVSIKAYLPDSQIQKIKSDLGQLREFNSDDGKAKRILPKSLIKDNINRSPTWLDIFTMLMVFEIKDNTPIRSSFLSV